MKKYLLGFFSVLFLSVLVMPSFSFAQVGDVDPNPTASGCISLQSSDLRYRARDANTNGEVSLLQDFLQSKGYLSSEPTGYFGILTLKAVKDFQKDSGISPTGYVGSLTKAKIKSASCGGEVVIDNDKECKIQKFTVNGSSSATIKNDEGVTLAWETANCASIRISVLAGSSSAYLPLSGTQFLSHPQTGTIVLYAYNGNSPAKSKTVSVTIVTEIFAIGDVDGNRLINCDDSNMILKSIAGSITLTADQKSRADIDMNGVVDVTDSVKLLQNNNLSCSTTTPSIAVLSPNGEAWQSGTNQIIRWKDSAYSNDVYYTIFVVRKDGGAYGIIADEVYGNSFNWNVGTLYDGRLGPLFTGETSYYIQIVRQTEPKANSLNYPFTISSTNTTAPHISDVTGPTTINANTAGTWKINAYSTTAVSYTVEWGDGQRQSFMPSSTFTHTYSTAGTYIASFSATNASGQSDSKNLSIVVIAPTTPAPVVSYFYSDKTTVDYGSTATMYWNSINATSCTASDGTYEGIKTTSGNMLTGSLTKTTTFSLKCTGRGGTSGTSYVTINVLPQTTPVIPLPTISFFTSPDSVAYNGTATINWIVTNATSCTAGGDWSGPKSATSGSEVAGYYLTSSKNYTLTCIGAGGGASASAKITVGAQVIPVELPLTPASFRITSASTSSINFAWTDTSNNETGFKIYKNNSLLATLGPNVTTYSDLAGFQCNTTYSYNIVAYNSAGESRISSSVTPGYTTCAVPEVVFGNVSGDGIVDCKDTTMIMQYIVGTTTFTDDQKNRADADRNGSVNSADVSYLLTKYNLSCSVAGSSSKPSLMASALDAFDDVKNTEERQETNTIKNEVKTQELSCGEFSIILKNGKTDPQVKCLQRLLNRNGFKVEGVEEGKETNFFGKATEKAVKAFQAKNGLVVDGVFGPLSRTFLK